MVINARKSIISTSKSKCRMVNVELAFGITVNSEMPPSPTIVTSDVEFIIK